MVWVPAIWFFLWFRPRLVLCLQVSEGNLPCGHYTLKVHSAFLTGIFGMWNLYVFSIVFLYAPSHKKGSESAHSLNADVKN